jgi:hypothetical protein
MNARSVCSLITLGAVFALPSVAHATFHLMQIEQLIVGVNGDPTAQAIQLRMRNNFQNFVSESRLVVVDAQGLNPITIVDMDSDVANGATGDRVLIASATFPGAVPDFLMTDIIPQSYFAAGSLMFQEDDGTVYWRLSWGGAAYTGDTTGNPTNDDDGDFGPPFAAGLPSCGVYTLQFTRGATARSTTNAADYRLTSDQSDDFVNNAGASFNVNGPLPTVRVNVLDAIASEQPANDTGRVRITRVTNCTQVALTARYSLSGTATNGQDYQMLNGNAMIPAGMTARTIMVRAINDAQPEPDETAIVTLTPNAAYTIGNPSSGTVTVRSNE